MGARCAIFELAAFQGFYLFFFRCASARKLKRKYSLVGPVWGSVWNCSVITTDYKKNMNKNTSTWNNT